MHSQLDRRSNFYLTVTFLPSDQILTPSPDPDTKFHLDPSKEIDAKLREEEARRYLHI